MFNKTYKNSFSLHYRLILYTITQRMISFVILDKAPKMVASSEWVSFPLLEIRVSVLTI